MKRTLVALPFLVFTAMGAMFATQLADKTSNSDIPSALIGKPAPALTLTPIIGLETPLLSSSVLGDSDLTILNIWASWCAPCRTEHPVIEELSTIEGINVVGVNHKDRPEDAVRFLSALGNPFDHLGADQDGRVSLQYGVYGLPETFIIDRSGIIRKKYVGAITPEIVEDEILPLISELKARS